MFYRYQLIILFWLLLGSCNKPSPGFDTGGPITQYLLGSWKLDKVVSPSKTKIGNQIGYTNTFESSNEGNGNFDRVYRNDTLIDTYFWSRDPWPIADATKMTVLVTYRGGLKRFFKIYRELGKDDVLETSAYLSEIGSAQDSVKYYYSRKN
ncbi:hypothetical protein SAMN04487995_1774 [Dyadobacter koreensis]|uniref:Uncharacterized protein n=1 Tax=Dyadobacter koreensis TaxID=408657 RepID=A0A1H6T195_9BACT|nr:hypothetical protein [Dyadobacter koreensis]SEI70030.1 hypothetical protein SAMN04487995_1774 [Dyadobacter koreensis]